MRKIERRAAVCWILAIALMAGVGLFVIRFVVNGRSWASSAFNRHMYNSSGQLLSGTVLDRDGTMLSTVSDGSRIYNSSTSIRTSTLHAVGDPSGMIGTGALTAFASKLSGYNLVSGAYNAQNGNQLYLTISAEYNSVAYQALGGSAGTVAVYNYKTGEILCMVSAPSYDPMNIPNDLESDPEYEGAYLNRFLSSTYTPGSTFKVVTTQAAIENITDLFERTFYCSGSAEIAGDTITCPHAHGEETIYEALSNSCNVVYAQLAEELGAETLSRYASQAGLTSSYSVNGLSTAKGSFAFTDSEEKLGWAAVGQGSDLVNPCAVMVYMGAIANGGKAAVPQLISKVTSSSGFPHSVYLTRHTGRLVKTQTAEVLADMMHYNVVYNYGEDRFPNMDLCAKSGTAETGGSEANAWFVGFLRNEDAPLAFVVLIEEGGSGSSNAGTVAARVLNAIVNG